MYGEGVMMCARGVWVYECQMFMNDVCVFLGLVVVVIGHRKRLLFFVIIMTPLLAKTCAIYVFFLVKI